MGSIRDKVWERAGMFRTALSDAAKLRRYAIALTKIYNLSSREMTAYDFRIKARAIARRALS